MDVRHTHTGSVSRYHPVQAVADREKQVFLGLIFWDGVSG